MDTAGQTYTVAYECSSGNEYDGRLAVRISSIFVIGFGSLCGMFGSLYVAISSWLMLRRSLITNSGCPDKSDAGASFSLLHNQVLRVRRYHCYSIYTCKYTSSSHASVHPQLALLEFSPAASNPLFGTNIR